jgi:hypothetical protein
MLPLLLLLIILRSSIYPSDSPSQMGAMLPFEM